MWGLRGVVVLLLALTLGACLGPSRLDRPDAGRTTVYQPGLPNFDMEAVATLRDGQPGLDLYLGVPRVSLVFTRSDSGYRAVYETIVRLLDARGRILRREEAFTDTVLAADYEATQDFRAVLDKKRFDVTPGAYLAEVTVLDRGSEKEAVRRQRVAVEAPGTGEVALSRIRMEGRRPGEAAFAPLLSLHLPGGLDSLRAVVEVYNARPTDVLAFELTLLRLPGDTSLAAPPYWLTPTQGSLTYQGVRFDRGDTLQVTRRPLAGVEEAVTGAFMLPPLDRGTYRVELTLQVTGPDRAAPLRYREVRDLSIRHPFFPRVGSLEQMIEALPYLAEKREMEEIRAAETAGERKRRFDAFWGKLLANRQRAAGLLALYYGRIEEANLFFTSYKEGWKTDRGMVYVLLGAPLQVDHRVDTELWHYSYGESDPAQTYVFERVRPFDDDTVFENYILLRQPFYQRPWRRAVERWREGTVL